MKRNIVLPVTSLLSIFLASLHLAGDIAYGAEKGGLATLITVAVLAIWLYGTLVLSESRTGHIIMLLGSLAGLTVFFAHLSGTGGLPDGELGKSSGVFFLVWTLLALAIVSLVSFILSMIGLWNLLRSRTP